MDMTKVKLLSSVAEIEKAAVSIGKSAGKLQESIHKAAVSIMKLWHGGKIEAGEAARLLTVIQSASPYHQKGFARWVRKFAVTLDWADDTKVWYAKPDKAHIVKDKTFTECRDNPFWTIKGGEAQEADPYDLAFWKMLQSAINKASKQMEKLEDTARDPNVMAAIRAIRPLIPTE